MKIRTLSWMICLCTVLLSAGCSKKQAPPPPRTQPELLLEIYDTARKQQYDAALLKIQKMRALDPTSVFLTELESTIRFNRLTAVVNTYLRMGKFDEALSTLQEYENKNGYSDATTKSKEQIFFIARLDRQIDLIKQARRSDELEQRLQDLKTLTKNVVLSPKIMNFVRKKQSIIPELRKMETELMLRELWLETMEQLKAGERKTGSVLAAAYALEVPGQTERIQNVLTDSDQK